MIRSFSQDAPKSNIRQQIKLRDNQLQRDLRMSYQSQNQQQRDVYTKLIQPQHRYPYRLQSFSEKGPRSFISSSSSVSSSIRLTRAQLEQIRGYAGRYGRRRQLKSRRVEGKPEGKLDRRAENRGRRDLIKNLEDYHYGFRMGSQSMSSSGYHDENLHQEDFQVDGRNSHIRGNLFRFIQYLKGQQQNIPRQTCPICEIQQLQISSMISFGRCGHKFCSNCLDQYISFKINSFQLIQCPLEDCQNKLQLNSESMAEQRMQPIQKQIYEKIVEHFEILSNPGMRRCQRVGCEGRIQLEQSQMGKIKMKKQEKDQQMIDKQKQKQQFAFEKSKIGQPLSRNHNPRRVVPSSSQQPPKSQPQPQPKPTNSKPSPLICPVCQDKHCALCFSLQHQGPCDKEMIKFLQRNKKFRQCKRCKKVVQKSQGCTHMTCLCGFYFCYMCGQQLVGQHICKKPSHLNCLQLIRWDIQHQQLFFQSNVLSFGNCLACLDLSSQRNTAMRILYSMLYILTIYPFTIILAFVITALFFVLGLTVLILAMTFMPLVQLCSEYHQFCYAQALNQCCGFWGLVTVTIIFYPICILMIFFEALYMLCCQGLLECNDIYQLFGEIATGFRNVFLMPFVLCINPQSLEVQQQQ